MKQPSASSSFHYGVLLTLSMLLVMAGCQKAGPKADRNLPSSVPTIKSDQSRVTDRQTAPDSPAQQELKDPAPAAAEQKAALVRSKWVGSNGPIDLNDPQQRSAADDPLAFLKMCREQYLAKVRDYRCKFHRRESFRATDAEEEQQIEILYREKPYSVDMRWLKKADHAKRVSYVAGRWERRGRELALIVPKGVLGMLTPVGVKLDIHGPEMRAASARPIDEFGFKKTLDRIIERCEKAAGDPRYGLRFVGSGELDNRPCYVIERRLPYGDGEGEYPDRLLVIYIDREWLVPTGCFSFADDGGENPLGSFVTTDVAFNVGLADSDF